MPNIVKRHQIANYLSNEPAGAATPTYSLMGTGFSSLNESPNAETKETQYINNAAKSSAVTKYGATWDYDTELIPDENAITTIYTIGRNQLTGGNAERDMVVVDLFQTPTEGAYPARKFKVSVGVSSFEPDENDMHVKGTLSQVGDPVQGTFNPTTKVFTAST